MEKYEFMNRTGEGAYGSVWRARDKITGALVAVKKMKDVPATDEEGEIAMREVRVLQLAKHVNIVNLLEAYKSQSGRLYLVFEYVERTLLQELKANRSGMPPGTVKSITWQLLQALGYLHRKQIIHRDVKPSNILLTERGVVKICDFGFARACTNEAADPAYTTYVVTRWYRPPEVLVGDTYGPPVDIWALGCIFAEMLVGRPLFPGKNHHDQLWLIIKCLGAMTERQLDLLDADPQFACFRLPNQSEIEPLEQRLSGVGPAAMQVLRACLDPDPKHRASADELLAMPYFHGVTDVLPVEELSAYPDSEMRSKLDRALAQDQANAAAAAAREAMLLMHSSRRLTAPAPNKPPQPPHQHASQITGPSGTASPGRPAPPQPQQQSQGAPPLPAKASTTTKLDPSVESQRPPLQRYITAPPGSMATRTAGQQAQLQPLAELYGQHLLPQRSRTGSESSQQNSPRAHPPSGTTGGGALVPVQGNWAPTRGRPSWRFSNDGSNDSSSTVLHPTVRQLCSVGRQPAQVAAIAATTASTAPGGGSTNTGAGAAATSVESSRAVPEQLPAATQRPHYQRATWNGSAAPRSICGAGSGGGAASSGGASNGGAGTGGVQVSAFSSSFIMNQPSVHDAFTLHRKAHSLAGNEGLPPASSAPVVIRHASGLGGLQGRSLAPPLGPGTTSGNSSSSNSGSAPSSGSFQLPPSSFGLPSTGTNHRMSASPPPLAYGTLRNASSVPLGPIPACSTGRGSNDGGGGAATSCISAHNFGPLPRSLQLMTAFTQTNGNSEGVVLEAEVSESSMADVAAGQNEGRRASDTVLYAALAIKDVKSRVEKVSHMILGPSRLQNCSQNDGASVGGSSSGGGNSSGGGAPALGALRAASFGRGGLVPVGTGPSSPDFVQPGNLPPLQVTPQRRISAPEAMAVAVLSGGGAASGAPGVGGVTSRPAPHTVLHTVNGGISYTQRFRHPSGGHGTVGHHHSPYTSGQSNGQQGHAQAAVVCGVNGVPQPLLHRAATDGADGADDSSTGTAHVLLPSLDVGYPGKAVRASSAGNGPSMGVTTRRPSKGALLRVYGPDVHCKREDTSKILLLEAVPEASVL
ncbi:hypothetical protein Vretifemale_3169 [Volvox reticuliferus]|uniref:cyclin-dependent kinase n=1 Tax=Volvox reticuliferus TaxID=1737510 RepID=A0A8J4FJ41_9CHLO|nr:hypothetical protein Vretifemale_3169 [Volvox reticuliferus]